MEKYDELSKQYETLKLVFKEKEKECLKSGMKWDDFIRETIDIKSQMFEVDKKMRQIQEAGFEVGKSWNCEIITLDEFIEKARSSELKDGDGLYFYSNGDSKTDVAIYPSDILADIYRTDLTHVMCFEKKEI